MPVSGQTKSRKIFIGDIHGQHGKLCALLDHLRAREGLDRSLQVFVGDLIDNQPGSHIDHASVLERVRGEVAAGRAICLMGNHEFNAVGWLMRHPETDRPLRPHTPNNRRQHQAFLDDVTEDSAQHLLWVEWFKTLPLFVDFGDIRAVHACWDQNAIARLRPWLDEENRLKPENWVHAFDKRHVLFHLLETILKGPELALPEGYSFLDKTGVERRHIRIRWWLNEATTYRQIAQVQPEMVGRIPDIALEKSACAVPEVAVVVGHYTLSAEPQALSERVVCVDYNAAKANHPLRAWIYDDGQTTVANGRFVSV
ncbi:metallophosphoesterase [Klebsiella sp. WOUb02]|uniref:metallophosphoesterase n=1 Tax=Klebsiella sp. WOUb02 TaxID=3161071 RepID=UPI003CFA7DD3